MTFDLSVPSRGRVLHVPLVLLHPQAPKEVFFLKMGMDEILVPIKKNLQIDLVIKTALKDCLKVGAFEKGKAN